MEEEDLGYDPLVSIIVPTRNRAEVLARSLPGFLDQDLPEGICEVIVADDGGDGDGAAIVAKALERPGLRFFRIPVNVGRAAARNAAISLARGKILIFTDDDCFVGPGFARAHLFAHQTSGGRGFMVTGPIVTSPAVPEAAFRPGLFAGWHRNPFPTCNASVLRDDLLAAGGFSEDFSLYGWEDAELACRLRARGLCRRFARNAWAVHFKPPEILENLLLRLSLERERGRMGAVFYRLRPTPAVAWLTKTSRPVAALDAALDRLFRLEDLTRRVESGALPPERLSPLLFRLILFHAEVSAARAAL